MTQSTSGILVVAALPVELGLEFEDVNVVYTGVGKVNAAYTTAKGIAQYKPKLVVNLGTAGSPTALRGATVACTEFFQADMDCRPLGLQFGETPFEDVPAVIQVPKRISWLNSYLCASADSFAEDMPMVRVVRDMEAYAIAKVCFLEAVPFVCVKYISDNCQNGADSSWQEALKHAPKALRKEFDQIAMSQFTEERKLYA